MRMLESIAAKKAARSLTLVEACPAGRDNVAIDDLAVALGEVDSALGGAGLAMAAWLRGLRGTLSGPLMVK